MANSVFDLCPVASRTVSFVLPAVPSAVPEGRRRIRTTLRSWGLRLGDDSSRAVAVACGEMLARGVRRAAGDPAGQLTVGVDVEGDQLILDVLDGAPAPCHARRPSPDEHDEDGWGLVLVDAHCTAHGSERTPGGRRRWAVITLPSGALPGITLDAEGLGSVRWMVEPAGAALAAAESPMVKMCEENVPFAQGARPEEG
ncbi:ATP-binding protein [Streptomyces sp. NPDC056296]|uniref:ATP-binding protein n=1 Tax=Streptomyces sp. NPDC056296 TaxID=3345775 RepID=UPI0035E2E52F